VKTYFIKKLPIRFGVVDVVMNGQEKRERKMQHNEKKAYNWLKEKYKLAKIDFFYRTTPDIIVTSNDWERFFEVKTLHGNGITFHGYHQYRILEQTKSKSCILVYKPHQWRKKPFDICSLHQCQNKYFITFDGYRQYVNPSSQDNLRESFNQSNLSLSILSKILWKESKNNYYVKNWLKGKKKLHPVEANKLEQIFNGFKRARGK
jgi:hypothetical protein